MENADGKDFKKLEKASLEEWQELFIQSKVLPSIQNMLEK
jgi:hypothetical protein